MSLFREAHPPSTSAAAFKTGAFFSLMMVSAALSMLRGVLVAAGSAEAEFARYAVTLATGYFLGYLLSFGSVEESYKSFPRLFEAGGFQSIVGPTANVFSRLIARGLALAVPVFVAGAALGSEWLVAAGLAVLFALVASTTSVVASVQRASSNHSGLAAGSLLRSALAFLLVVPASYLGDIRWVLAAELVAGAVGLLASFCLAGFKWRDVGAWHLSLGAVTDGVLRGFNSNRGLLVSISAVFVSIPFYLDRMFVVSVFPAGEAANYSLLALFLGAATLLINTIAQRVGAESVKLVARNGNLQEASLHVLRWAFAGTVAWIAFIGVVGSAFHWGLVPQGLAKYEISTPYLAPVAVLGALSVTALVEFLLLATDGERRLFMSSSAYLAMVLLAAAWVAWSKSDLQELLWLLVVARASYLLLLCASLVFRAASGAKRPT